jgi:hypothetical protein
MAISARIAFIPLWPLPAMAIALLPSLGLAMCIQRMECLDFIKPMFTEFMEQRAPGHTTLDGKVFRYGFKDHIKRIDAALKKLDHLGDALAYAKPEQLRPCASPARPSSPLPGATPSWPQSWPPGRRPRAQGRAAAHRQVCAWVPAHAPRDFHEALQHYWFIHLGIITELNPWDAINPGRLDQHLLPFYEAGAWPTAA